MAGLQTSASGNVKHNRHVWKTDRGRGLSRYPKKRMSDKDKLPPTPVQQPSGLSRKRTLKTFYEQLSQARM
jgi:hypothetical protein